MPDRLIRFEALEGVMNTLNSAANLATQKANLAEQKATEMSGLITQAQESNAYSKTLNDQMVTLINRAGAAEQAAQNAANLASQRATEAQASATQANTNANYAKQQGDYAKEQGDRASTILSNVGNMLRVDYDNGGNAPQSVDNARKLGGVEAKWYALSSGEVGGIKSAEKLAVTPNEYTLQAPGFARFRLGTVGESGNIGPYVDAIDLSTGKTSTSGGVNSLQFRKDTPRIIHKFSPWGASSWSSVRELAYLDEVVKNAGSQSITGELYADTLRAKEFVAGGEVKATTVRAGNVLWGEAATRTQLTSSVNNKNSSGYYFMGLSDSGMPQGIYSTSTGYLIQVAHPSGTNRGLQIFGAESGDSGIFFRIYNEASATAKSFAWSRIWHSGNFNPSDYARKSEISDLATKTPLLGDSYFWATDKQLSYYPSKDVKALEISGKRLPVIGITEYSTDSTQPADYNIGVKWTHIINIGGLNTAVSAAISLNNPTFVKELYAPSRREYKTNIRSYADNALKAINDLEVMRFAYKESPERERIGFIVDDITERDFISADGMALDMQSLVSVLVKAVQELSAEVERLKQ